MRGLITRDPRYDFMIRMKRENLCEMEETAKHAYAMHRPELLGCEVDV